MCIFLMEARAKTDYGENVRSQNVLRVYHALVFIRRFCFSLVPRQCMARYMFRTFVYPGKRVTYLGKPVEHHGDEDIKGDRDWMME